MIMMMINNDYDDDDDDFGMRLRFLLYKNEMYKIRTDLIKPPQ